MKASRYCRLESDANGNIPYIPNILANNIKNSNSQTSNKSTGQVFGRIESVNPGSINIKKDTTLTATVTTRKFLRMGVPQYTEKFKLNKPLKNTWSFDFKNKERSSFIILIMKKKLFGEKEIEEIELNLDAFETNCVTTQEFTLHSPKTNVDPPRVRITVHVSENGMKDFFAPKSKTIKNNYQITHCQTIF